MRLERPFVAQIQRITLKVLHKSSETTPGDTISHRVDPEHYPFSAILRIYPVYSQLHFYFLDRSMSPFCLYTTLISTPVSFFYY